MQETIADVPVVAAPPATLRAKATGSGAERWMHCPGSVRMEFGLPQLPSSYAEEGTRAHEKASEAIRDNTPIEDITDPAVRIYVETVRMVAGEGPLVAEERLPLLGSSGQIDCYAIRSKIGYLFDLKYGMGFHVTAPFNPQIAFYGAAMKEKYPQLTTIQAYIIQPRVEGVFDEPAITSWLMPWQTIRAWRNKFERALEAIEKSQELHGGSWCRFCRARGGCPIWVGVAEDSAMAQEANEINPFEVLPAYDANGTPMIIGEEWIPAIIPRIEHLMRSKRKVVSWYNKAEEFLLSLLLIGDPIVNKQLEHHGFTLGTKRTNRAWKDMPDTVIAEELKSRGVPDDEVFEWKLIKLTQAEKICKIDDLVVKPPGEPKLKIAFDND